MPNLKKKIDINQTSIFDVLLRHGQEAENGGAKRPDGSLDVDRRFREAISSVLKDCKLSRYGVAARMSELTSTEITKTMLDSWTAESKENHRFPAIYLPAFCEAAGSAEPLAMLARLVGVFVLPSPDALRAEIQRIEEEITVKQREKKKRMLFLKEMGAKEPSI
jgi:hypothetical protein